MAGNRCYIRTDMNETIATGHMMRCLAIADAARELGMETTFILADSQAAALLQEWGYGAVILDTRWNDMEAEVDLIKKVIDACDIRVLLVDSYMVTYKYLQTLSTWTNVAYIDDLDAFTYPVHTLICYANYWEKFQCGERYRDTRLLLGSKYTPLRKEFANCKEKVIKPETENLLLLSGGTDTFHILDGLLERIHKSQYKDIDVICGRYYDEYIQLCDRYHLYHNIHFHKAVNNIMDYMIKADIAVSAGGTTLYELCVCGTPTISYSIADNQSDNVKKFHEDQVIDYAGDIREGDVLGHITQYLELYQKDIQLRLQRSRRMQSLVDGRGALRIAEALMDMC